MGKKLLIVMADYKTEINMMVAKYGYNRESRCFFYILHTGIETYLPMEHVVYFGEPSGWEERTKN